MTHRTTGFMAPVDRYAVPVLFNPYTGDPRDVRDVQSDPQGILIVPPGKVELLAAKALTPTGMTDALMDLAELLGSDPATAEQIDHKAWQHLLTYAPAQAAAPKSLKDMTEADFCEAQAAVEPAINGLPEGTTHYSVGKPVNVYGSEFKTPIRAFKYSNEGELLVYDTDNEGEYPRWSLATAVLYKIPDVRALYASPPDRRVLQADGKHPAPCAKFCEATAFNIELRQAQRAMRLALEALHVAKNGLDWFKDSYPQDVNGSDDEAGQQIDAAIAALDGQLK